MGKIKCVQHNLIKGDRHLLGVILCKETTWYIVDKHACMCNTYIVLIGLGREAGLIGPQQDVSVAVTCTHYMHTCGPRLLQKHSVHSGLPMA